MILRGDQLKARAEILDAFASGARRVLFQAPTAWGKGSLACSILDYCFRRGKRAAFLAHLQEINLDLVARLRGMGIPVGVMMGGLIDDPSAPVWVCSVQTLVARDCAPGAFDMVIWDEAHRQPNDTCTKIAAAHEYALHLGLTATPERGDGKPLGFFDKLIMGPTAPELVAAGVIAPVSVYAPYPLSHVAQQAERDRMREKVKTWPLYTSGRPRPGIVFSTSTRASRIVVQKMAALGFRAQHVDATTKNRKDIIKAFNDGDLDILSCYRLFVEGVDIPRAEVCALQGDVGRAGPLLQMIGRVRRRHRHKTHSIILDIAGNCHRWGLPDEARDYSLEGDPIQRVNDLTLVHCDACDAWHCRSSVCSTCARLTHDAQNVRK